MTVTTCVTEGKHFATSSHDSRTGLLPDACLPIGFKLPDPISLREQRAGPIRICQAPISLDRPLNVGAARFCPTLRSAAIVLPDHMCRRRSVVRSMNCYRAISSLHQPIQLPHRLYLHFCPPCLPGFRADSGAGKTAFRRSHPDRCHILHSSCSLCR